MLTCVAPRFRRLTLPTYPADFNVYYCASTLVRHGQAAALYTGADTGSDPQKALAPAGSPLLQTAQAHGLSFVGLYVYPPVLADLMTPYTLASLPRATHLWLLSSGFMLIGTALAVIGLLRFPLWSWQAALIALTVACFTPALQCLVDGQITIFLLLLWALGMLFYQRDHDLASGVVFALAAAIKLTPAIVVLPLLFWRKWRLLAAFGASLVLLAALDAWIDGPGTLATYFLHVMPAMSGALPVYSNYSLPASVQRMLFLLHTGSVPVLPTAMPKLFVVAGRAASLVAALTLTALLVRTRSNTSRSQQVVVLGVLSLVAPVLSPVSWFHAYTTAYLAFAVLWYECFLSPPGTGYLITLTVVSLLLGSAVSENIIPKLLFAGHDTLSSLLHLGQLLAALGLIFYRLAVTPSGTGTQVLSSSCA